MHFNKVAIVLAAYAMVAECLFFDGGITVAGGGLALAALFGIKAAGIGGLALGAALSRRRSGGRRSYGRSSRRSYGRRRYGRSVEDVEVDEVSEILLEASLNDELDCAKKLVCKLNAAQNLSEDEAAIAHQFGKTETIDLKSLAVEFDLAAFMGRKAGDAQCELIYSRCPYGVKDLMEVIRQPEVYLNQI